MLTGPERPGRTEDDLRAALPMLERHAPSPDAVLRTVRDGSGRGAPGLVHRGAVPPRWRGWLAPMVAAAAVVGVILASLAISGAILYGPAGTGPANSSGVLAKVPRYFVGIPQSPGRAIVSATVTGTVLGTVAPPKPYTMFRWAAAAGDDRTFVLGATPGVDHPVRFYRLTLSRSGHPGRLAPLPVPTQTATITGAALSPDGSKLAVSLLGSGHEQTGSKIQVFSLATGAMREWVWPGHGTISSNSSNSWEEDNRTLLFEVTTRIRTGWAGQLRLLDTATPGGSLQASSTPIPIPGTELGWQHNNARHRITGIPLITGDGTTLVAPFFHASAPPKVFGFTITMFSARTGKPTQVLYWRRADSEADATGVMWANNSGTAIIAIRPPPGQSPRAKGNVYGVQTPTTFTPLPPSTQRLLVRHGLLFLLPAW